MAASFLAQMQQAASEIGAAGNDEDGGDDDPDAFTLPDLPPDAAALQAKYGATSGASDLFGGAAEAAGQAGTAASLLNAPVTSAGPVSASAGDNAKVVARIAAQRGVDPTLAVAMMLVESGGNASAVGDGGTSFGLFQLHEGGMLTGAGLSPQQAFDPATNADVALRSLAREAANGGNRTPGQVAAASQRPADKVGYAAKVDAAMAQARSLLGA